MRPSTLAAAALFALITSALAAPGLARAADVSVRAAVLRASIGKSPNTAGYMTLINDGAAPDRLVSARCACAGMVMIHKTEMAHGMAMMADAPAVVVPAHGQVRFQPGGLHLMVMDLKKPLIEGDSQDVVLVFEHAGPVTARFAVRSHVEADSATGPMGPMPGMGR
jgi:copper(I)-binding protein